MRRYASQTLRFVAIAYMAFPVTYLVASALLFEMSLSQCGRLLLSPAYYLFGLLGAIAGYGILELRRWSWYLVLFVHFLAVYSNAILITEFSNSSHPIAVYFLSVTLIASVTFLVSRELRVPYIQPRIRWWESDPRHRLSLPGSLTRMGQLAQKAELLDLGPLGCFFKTRDEFKADENVLVEIHAFGLHFRGAGSIFWRTQSGVTVPKGVGVKFQLLPKEQRRALKLMLKQINRINRLYRSSRYLLSQEEYFRRLADLQQENLAPSIPLDHVTASKPPGS